MGLNPLYGPHRLSSQGIPLPRHITREQRILAAHFLYDPALRLLSVCGNTTLLVERFKRLAGISNPKVGDRSTKVEFLSELLTNYRDRHPPNKDDPEDREKNKWLDKLEDRLIVAEQDHSRAKDYLCSSDKADRGEEITMEIVHQEEYEPRRSKKLKERLAKVKSNSREKSCMTQGGLDSLERAYGTLLEEEKPILRLIARPFSVYGDYVPQEYEVPASEGCPLSARVMSLLRMGKSELYPDTGLMVMKLVRQFRLQPTSDDRIAKEFLARHYVIKRPVRELAPVIFPSQETSRWSYNLRDILDRPDLCGGERLTGWGGMSDIFDNSVGGAGPKTVLSHEVCGMA
jgi:hypothetical protein